jgi:tRNA-guanine family transglycosylase
MPVATQGSIKGLTSQQMEALGVTIMLNNTYHLNLRPGIKILNEAEGAHKFQGWSRNLLTVVRLYYLLIRTYVLIGVGQWRISITVTQ